MKNKGRSLFHLGWFTLSWWKYLLEKPIGWKAKNYCSFWQRFWCRAKGHPEGVWYYSNNNEPDMTCKNCGDDLG